MKDEAAVTGSGGFSGLRPGKKVGPGRFTLVKELGRGGMGVVWLAQDTSLGEQVALKFLPPEVCHDPVALNDLRRETVRSHRLTHPNIIRIHDFHQQPDGVAFICMEYVDGQTLSGWRLQQEKQVFTWEQLAPLVKQLCAALEYAHGEGVIHRDLKPANVMVDRKGRVKLADFGIAAVVTESVSRVSARSRTGGTLAYMSPQQLEGKLPTVADDIYALGASLYELLTGRPPFYTGDLTHQILHVPASPVGERALELGVDNPVPETVGALVLACLSKAAERRPQSAAAVAAWVGLMEQSGSPMERFAEAMGGQERENVATAAEAVETSRASSPILSRLKQRWVWAGSGVAACLLVVAGIWVLWPKVDHRSSGVVLEDGVGLSSAVSFGTAAPASPKRTAILFSQAHGEGHWPVEFEQDLERSYSVEVSSATLSSELLKDRTLLVLAAPTRALAADEVRSVLGFIQEGGGLLVLGDKGGNCNINELLRPLGVAFSDGMICAKADWNERLKYVNFTVDNIQPHFITMGVPRIQVACSSVLTSHGNGTVVAWTSAESWAETQFNQQRDAGEAGGPFPYAVALELGKGRVVVVADDTFDAYLYRKHKENRRFILQAVDWLAYRDEKH